MDPSSMRGTSGHPAEDDAGLPPDLVDLLCTEGLVVVRSVPITTRPGRASVRRTFRIELADGRIVKGRILRAEAVASMRRWLPALPEDAFPHPLALSATATLEPWVDGQACAVSGSAALREAGGMLGRLHAVLPPVSLAWQDARLAERWGRILDWIDRVRSSGAMDRAKADRLGDLVSALRPARATWGLRHGDFCQENLVVSAGGLRSIDNATILPGTIELDLAQTFYRWPLDAKGHDDFLAGYRRHADDRSYFAHQDFWDVVALLRSAGWRLREQTDGAAIPLRRLEARVG